QLGLAYYLYQGDINLPLYSLKYAAKQVLNRTETNEIPTMDTSKNTDTLGSQILGNTMEGLYRLDKDNKPIPAVAESSTKSEDGKK
ncbi:hypothetical protein ACT453_52100, partial [Bacillus sp. D-CC]